MDSVPVSHRAVECAVLRLLRPLVRLLLRHGVPFGSFEALAKQAYVQVAQREFALPGKKPSASRASILTGLTRKEVQRLLAETAEAAQGGDTAEGPASRHNRAVRVLGGWTRDADFLGPGGAPRPLHLDGPDAAPGARGEPGFAELVRRHSGDMPARAVLDELLRVGAVQRRPDGRIEPVARGYVPQQSTVDKLHMLGTDVADLIDTIDHNLEHGATDPRYQRKVMYRRLDPAHLPAFRALSSAQAQALLESLDRWLALHDTSPPPEGAPAARAGLGIYYFEDVSSRSLSEGEAP
jgi:Family of unknown function (DUF6502)